VRRAERANSQGANSTASGHGTKITIYDRGVKKHGTI